MSATSRLQCELNPMPDGVLAALREAGRLGACRARRACRRNGCLGWIVRAKREDTRDRRLRQMPEELRDGGVYMNMARHPRAGR
ncbi:YdeI/OmpD-associated family protein [Marilutibacter chinensis]|uniref:YdeI/OmpD-associated family protein n=1 Tax=Marilutibacter chinensis TaxID=2912247 RepID=A0ABS9HSM6_9GAMM|nr:YdeI/OmpD-associated family protein [Lysobacter chinensis]MCF7221924.1 YdeI/OmpD-associated family protein [Lysobacter chinensis]